MALSKYIKTQEEMNMWRNVMYLVITGFICFFFWDIHTQAVNIVDKERYMDETSNELPAFDSSIYEYREAVPEFDYYGKYIRKIAYNIVQIIFLVALMLRIWVVEYVRDGEFKQT